MKKTKLSLLAGVVLIAGLLMLAVTGCKIPSRFLFTARTNDVPVIVAHTNVVSITNFVDRVISTTNLVTEPGGSVTTVITQLPVHEAQVSSVSRVDFTTNYLVTYTVSTNASSLAETAGSIANMVAPGSGGLVTTGITGLLGLFAAYFTRRQTKKKGELIAGTLAQSIETLREVLRSNPTTQHLDGKIVSFLQSQQASVGVIQEVARLVENTVDNEDAKHLARTIIEQTK